MAKLINILAASVGGGLMLGAGIRLGEALVGRDPLVGTQPETSGELATRLGGIEERLQHLETERRSTSADDITTAHSSIEKQASEVDARVEALSEMSTRLRGELQTWLEDNVGKRIAEVEAKLRSESEQSRKEMLDAFVEGVQTRVMHRISKLENELANQSTAMTELRECSIRTEQSMQKLLGGLDRLLVTHQEPVTPPETAPAPSATKDCEGSEEQRSAVESQASPQLMSRPKRWAIFG